MDEEVRCKDHPDAPHGFDRNASHTLHRYVCTCEHWGPPALDENDEGGCYERDEVTHWSPLPASQNQELQ